MEQYYNFICAGSIKQILDLGKLIFSSSYLLQIMYIGELLARSKSPEKLQKKKYSLQTLRENVDDMIFEIKFELQNSS